MVLRRERQEVRNDVGRERPSRKLAGDIRYCMWSMRVRWQTELDPRR
jgi:hypothetical protein